MTTKFTNIMHRLNMTMNLLDLFKMDAGHHVVLAIRIGRLKWGYIIWCMEGSDQYLIFTNWTTQLFILVKEFRTPHKIERLWGVFFRLVHRCHGYDHLDSWEVCSWRSKEPWIRKITFLAFRLGYWVWA